MREVISLFRAAWLTETSYRVNMIFSVLSLALVIVPVYFVANALQPTMQATIESQSKQYFAFLLLGGTIFTFVTACTSALPNALSSSIARGTLEAFLGTPTPVAALFAGMSAYSIAWALFRAVLTLAAGVALGAQLHWSGLPAVSAIVGLLVLAYGSIGLMAGALILRFRTSGPLLGGTLTLSALLGGVYYPTHVIPSWLQDVSRALPMSYGLRAARQATLLGQPFPVFGHDVLVLGLYVTALLPIGILSLGYALNWAKHSGSLSHY
jgi:ABC-2 type transport system permease protein